jgi:hypothetical protein
VEKRNSLRFSVFTVVSVVAVVVLLLPAAALTSASARAAADAVQLPVRSKISVVGNLPGEGDHRGRDQYAVDFVGGGGGTVNTVAVGTVAYAGWNCQKASPEQQTCYGFSMVVDHGPSEHGEIYSVYTHLECDTLVQFSSDDFLIQELSDLCTTTDLGADRELAAARGLPVPATVWLGSISDSGCRDAQNMSHCVNPPGPDSQGLGKHLHFAVHSGAAGLIGAQSLYDNSLTAVNVWDSSNAWHMPGLPSPPARGQIRPCWSDDSGPPDASCLVGTAPMSYTGRQQATRDEQIAQLRSHYLPWQGDAVSLDFDYRAVRFVATLTRGLEDEGNAELDQFLRDHGIMDRSWIHNLVVGVGS